MTRSGPVLLAYDGSESSAIAIAVAGRLLPGRQALVCYTRTGVAGLMTHVGPAGLPVAPGVVEELDRADRQEAEKTAAAGVLLAEGAGFDPAPLLVRDPRQAWRALLQAAGEHDASLIVAGAHGISGIGRALLGSVSTGLVHHAHLPILVVPAAAREEERAGPLLLCYDGSESAQRAIESAAELLEPREALVLHFWESWVAEAPALASLSKAVEGMATELDEIGEDLAEKIATEGVELAEQAGLQATSLTERATGPGWMAVRDAAGEHACSVIVIGSRGRTGVSAALGSVSNGVVHNSRRPVLVVPPASD